jgi:hypothetical protein
MSEMASDDMSDDEFEEWAQENIPDRTNAGKVRRTDLSHFKMIRADDDKGCEACDWVPSAEYRKAHENWYKMLHVHHVIPAVCMGESKRHNLVVLCPNCHAFAHKMGSITGSQFERKRWSGPSDKAELIAALRAARSGEIAPGATPEVTPPENAGGYE